MPDRFSPLEIARAYREEFPGKFDDLDDFELFRAIEEIDPASADLIDPMLRGAELLAPTRTRQAPPRTRQTTQPFPVPWGPLSTPPPALGTGDVIATTGMRIVPAVVGAIGGGVLGGPAGVAVGGAGGAGLGETAAQWYEKAVGPREAFSPGSIAFETALGAVNPAARGATTGRRVLQQAGYGAGLGAGGTVGRSVIERGELPPVGEVALGAGLGGAFGAGVQGAAEGVRGLGRMAPSFGDATGALPTEPGPPPLPPMWDLDAPPDPLTAAVTSQYALEEQRLAQGLREVYGPAAVPPGQRDFHTALEAKDYLEQIAENKVAMETVGGLRANLETAMELGPPGPPPLSPRLLPAAGGTGPGQAGPPAGPFTAYPPGLSPDVELVGAGAQRPGQILGARDVGAAGALPPPTFEQALESSLSQPPGPPRLVHPLVLSSQEATVPRGMAQPAGDLLPPPTRPNVFEGPIEQGARMGGRPPTAAQGRIPGVETPAFDRPYAAGPNAGPRQRGERHGEPRQVRRRLQTGKTFSFETHPSTLRAEDPGTYPPEVRRELAAMAWELQEYPWRREAGGVTGSQLDAMVESGVAHDRADATAQLRKSGATGGGTIAGAPVYHEVIRAAEGSFPNVQRSDMLQHIRAAILEGRGTGLSDAAAQVARARLARRQAGQLRSRMEVGEAGQKRIAEGEIIARRGDEGDALIGWVDETGARTLPDQDLDEFTRAARDADTSDLYAAYKLRQAGEVAEGTEPYFEAATTELVRRGVITPEQQALQMEGPGGAGGPRVLDFEGGPPARPDQPSLPGAEGVRQQEIPIPEVAEAPFALTPPPTKPAIAPRTGNLFQDLMREEGVLVFNIPAGDRKNLQKWLDQQEADHGGEAWFNRAEQAIEEGNWDRAWQAAMAASRASYARAYKAAKTPGQRAAIEAGVRGTILQSDMMTDIVAGARQRAGVGTAPPVKGAPPSIRVTRAGAARGRGTLGPAGILNPGARQRPLSSAAPALRAATLDKEVVRLIMDVTGPEGMATIPGNTDTYLRLFRQVGEKIYRGQNLQLLRDAGVRIPAEELAQHFNATISDAGRTLQLLSSFAQAHAEVLGEAAERLSFGGQFVGARGRVVSPAGQRMTQEVVDEIAERTSRYQAAALTNDLQKRQEVGPLRAIHDASYAWMLSKWATAVRNYASFAGRYGVDSLDHALTIPTARLLGDEPTAQLSSALLKERGLQPTGKVGTAVTPWKGGWAEDLQGIYDFTSDNLSRLKPTDARRAIRLLLDQPEQAAHFLGAVQGEDLSAGYTTTPVLRHLTNPKVQRFLTMFNRAQEFSARATVFDGTVRALLRAKGLDPSTTLLKQTPEIIEAVGGQRAFDDLLFTATAQSLEATFAGRTSKDSIPGALIRFINDAWPLKLGMPFPRFNLSAAPRWIFDHGPWALVDLIRFPLDRAGITAPKGTVAGGRLYRGVRAQEIVRTELPALQAKIGQAERLQGESLQELLGTQREWAVRQRQIARLEKRAQQGLPDVATTLEQARELQAQLGRRREQLKSTVQEQRIAVSDLQSEQKKLLNRVTDATGINAPNYAQFLARMGVGTAGMLGAAWVVRAQEGAQGTKWYEYRIDRGEGRDPIVLDFRPFAPFAQYLFVADVLQDFWAHTDWDAVRAETSNLPEEVPGPLAHVATALTEPFDWSRAMWDNYEGKYTEGELGRQFGQAFLSISRAAGTTLTLTDLITQNNWASPEEAARAAVGTIGQFLSRFTVPGQQISDIAISSFSTEEAKVRTPPRATLEDWERPLAAPLANVPFARRLIPERISQTSGQPVAAEYPLLRGLLGIGTQPRDFVVEEVQRIGLPGATVYIRETGDVGLDRLVAETYARNLGQWLPEILESDFYTQLQTPARQRDYLQRYVFPQVKRASLGEVRGLLGEERYGAATVRGENARRQARQQRMIEALEGESGQVVEEGGPPGPPEPDPFDVLSPPPGPPELLQGPPGPPAF